MKKGLVKASLIVFFFLVFFGIIFLLLFSSAYSNEKVYFLNEGIHLNLKENVNYTLRIITPSEEFVTKGSGDSIYYSPKEIGIYTFFIYYGEISEKYSFRVIEKKENKKEIKSLNSTTNETNNNFTIYNKSFTSQELLSEGYKIKERIEINKPVVWEKVNGNSNEEKITPSPKTREKNNSELEKEVVVYSEENVSYLNVLSYTVLPKEASNKDLIKIYWKENKTYLDFEAFDKDENGLLDYVEWIVPHLSNQTFNIIVISKAEHLFSNKTFISDIYEEVKELDDIWSETINSEEYVRITFEKNLTKENDITLYPRIVSGNPTIEVYEEDKNELIAKFEDILSNEYNKIFLTNLIGEQDTFDLKIINGSIEFDYILDPTLYIRTGTDSYVAGTPLVISFLTAMPSTSYSILFSGQQDTDAVFSIQYDNKATTGFRINRVHDDGGANESAGIEWATLSYGEYNFGDLLIKCNTGAGTSTATTSFTSAFPDTNYAVVSYTPFDTDSPRVSYSAKTTNNWSSVIQDDGGALEAVSSLDWCAISYGYSTIQGVTIMSGVETVGATPTTPKIISLPDSFSDTNYIILTTASRTGTQDPCEIEVSAKTTTSFNITAEDDDTTNNCGSRQFNWIAISTGTYLVDLTSPSYFSISVNNTAPGQATLFSINVLDETTLNPNGQYIFSTNNTGTWINDSLVNFTETPSWANVTKTLNSTIGTLVGYRWYFNDSAGNRNLTSIYTILAGDSLFPYFTYIPPNASLFYGNESLGVDFDAEDETEFGYYKINDTRFSINQSGYLSNVTSLAVGNYEINVSINDTSNNINWTIYSVQINKSNYDCAVYFNTTSPIIYPEIFRAYTNCSSTYNLYINGTLISNGSIINSGAGYWNLTVQRTDIQNYTYLTDFQFFTINKNSEECQVLFNETSPLQYPKTFLVWANCTTPFNLYRNGTLISNNSEQELSTDYYNFSMLRADSENYTFYYDETNFDVVNYFLNIINPTTANPLNVSDYQNISLYFNFLNEGANLTSGVEVNSVFIDGVEANILNVTEQIFIRSNNNGTSSGQTIYFSPLQDTQYAVLFNSLTDTDTVYSSGQFNTKNTNSFTITMEDDGGAGEAANFMWSAIPFGLYTLNGTTIIQCGNTSGSDLTLGTGGESKRVYLNNSMSDSNYAVVCSVEIDADTPRCGLDSQVQAKNSTTFGLQINDDGGAGENVTNVDYCAFSFGEYSTPNINFKAGTIIIGASGITNVTFANSFPDTTYVVFLTHNEDDSGDMCACETTVLATNSFTSSCEDDGGATASCVGDTMEWVAFTRGTFNENYVNTNKQVEYISEQGWQINVTVPPGMYGLQDLFINATSNGYTREDTEIDAINYGDIAPPLSYFGENPVNFYNTSLDTITFDVKCSDNFEADTIKIYGNWTGSWQENYTNSSYINNTWLNISISGIPQGYYRWAVWCNDSFGNSNWTNTNRTFRIDSIPPTINITFPKNNSNTSDTNLDIRYNVRDLGVGISNCWYSNDTYSTNISLTNCINITNVIWGLGSHNITIWANDTLNNLNSSTINFNIEHPISVIINFPLGENISINNPVFISVNISSLAEINFSKAEITYPNSTKVNISLSENLQLEEDNFDANTLGEKWWKENSNNGPSQFCTADINTTISGKAFTSLMGDGTPETDTFCSIISNNILDGDFDINISWNVLAEEDSDWAANFLLTEINSSANATKMIYMDIAKWTAQERAYEIFADDGNFSDYILIRPSSDTFGKFRINRTGNIFTFYTWNNSEEDWNEETVSENNFSMARQLYLTIESENSAQNWGYINISWDNFSVQSDNYRMGLFNDASIQGIYNVKIFTNNSIGIENNTQTTYFGISDINTPPSMPYILIPVAGEKIRGMYSILWAKSIDKEGDSLKYNLTLLNPNLSFNSTIIDNYGNSSSNSYSWNTASKIDGNYTIRITVYENTTLEHYSRLNTLNGNFTIDNSPPRLNIIYPTNNTNVRNTGLDIIYTVADLGVGISNCWYSNDTYSTNISLPNCINITNVIWGLGSHNITIWANDTLNNINSSTINFNVVYSPLVIIDSPLGQLFDEAFLVPLVINVTDVAGISKAIAQVEYLSNKQNITLYNSSIQDDFNSDSVGISWKKEDFSIGENQECIADIDTTMSGKAVTSISGDGSPETDTYCSLISKDILYKDFDINISFNMTSESGIDYAMLFKLTEINSSINSSKNIFLSIGNWTGYGRTYDVFISDGTISEYVSERETEDTFGKFRIKREENNFTFYIWNNSEEDWTEEYFAENLNFSFGLHLILEAETAFLGWGNVSIEWENLEADKEELFIGKYYELVGNLGLHNVTFFVNNTYGVWNNTQKTNFTIANINYPPTTPFILFPAPGEKLNAIQEILWSKVYDLDKDKISFNITLLNPDLSFNSTIINNYGNLSAINYFWNTSNFLDGVYSLKVEDLKTKQQKNIFLFCFGRVLFIIIHSFNFFSLKSLQKS